MLNLPIKLPRSVPTKCDLHALEPRHSECHQYNKKKQNQGLLCKPLHKCMTQNSETLMSNENSDEGYKG